MVEYHKTGRGLVLWGDNAPYFYHVNLLLKEINGCQLIGNTNGSNTMVAGNSTTTGQFGSHMITSGLKTLFEGNKIPGRYRKFHFET